MNIKVCLIALFVCLSLGFIKSDNVPVLMYFKNKQLDNTITIGQSLKSSDFMTILNNIESNVHLIEVNELNDEDLRSFLKQELSDKHINYQPLVESPMQTIRNFLVQNSKIKSTIDDLKDDVNGALSEFLKKMSGSTSDTIILTGSNSKKLNRLKRDDDDDDDKDSSNHNYTYVYGNNCAALYKSVYLIDFSDGITGINLNLNVSSSTFTCSKDISTLTLNFQGSTTIFKSTINQMNLVFVNPNSSQYWTVSLNSTLVTSSNSYGIIYMGTPYGMETPTSFSFVCTRPYFQLFNNTKDTQPYVKVSLYFDELQIQPFDVSVNSTVYNFGRINYCQGFFSNGIWMGIISTLLLTAILAYGVVFLFNINTMDRFDDPKGKPLNIAIEK